MSRLAAGAPGTAQRALVAASTMDVYGKLELTDPDGDWVDVSADLDTPDWLTNATLTEALDANCMKFSAVLLGGTGSLSLMPLMEGSVLNRDGDDDYAPMVDVRRKWRLSTAVVARGDSPASGDWHLLGEGYLDTIDGGGTGEALQITGRDLGALLLDTYIESATIYGGDDPDTAPSMEEVIQAILDDNLGSAAPTLSTPVSPSFVISPTYKPEGNVMEAINAVASLAGFVVRYRYDAAGDFLLTLYEPNRAATAGSEVWSVGPSEYLTMPLHRLDLSGVRNYIEVTYVELPGGAQRKAHSPATGTSESLVRYGRRYMAIDLPAASQINTAERAQAFADAVRSDLEFPALEQQFETFGFWFAQLGDYGKFLHNDVHYDTDQYGGVTQIQHMLANGTLRSVVDVRGTPSGRYRTWLAYGGQPFSLAPFLVSAPRVVTATSVDYEVTFLSGCAFVEFFTTQHAAASGSDPLETDVYLAGRLLRPTSGGVATFVIATDASQWRRTFVVGYTDTGTRGTVTPIMEDQAEAADTPTTAPSISAHTAHGTSVDVTVDHNGVHSGLVRLYVNGSLNVEVDNSGGSDASQVVKAINLAPSTVYSITATQVVASVESAASSPLSTSTTSVTLDAPTGFSAAGFSGDPKVRFYWTPGANAGGAWLEIFKSATDAWGGEETVVALVPLDAEVTEPGATSAGSNTPSTGSYYFRARALQTGYTASAWTASDYATYGGDDA